MAPKDGRCHCRDESVKIVHGEEPASERCPICGRPRYIIRIVRREAGPALPADLVIRGIDLDDF